MILKHSFFLILFFLKICNCQQCRYVTIPVCDGQEEVTSSTLLNSKGEKGERGFSGKSGPAGPMGEVGSKGQKGETGLTVNFEQLQESLENRLNDIEAKLDRLFFPQDCAHSSVVGYQKLMSGEFAYCDGGWTVFQKRHDGSVNFQRNWNEYKTGFGNYSSDFWTGLEKLHQETNRNRCRLRVDIWSFDGDHAYAEYSQFSIASEEKMYRLHVDGYSGTAGNVLSYHNNVPFTTIDRDNDQYSGNCPRRFDGEGGGWWYVSCYRCRLNAAWGRSTGDWHKNACEPWKDSLESLNGSEMKYRCDCCD